MAFFASSTVLGLYGFRKDDLFVMQVDGSKGSAVVNLA